MEHLRKRGVPNRRWAGRTLDDAGLQRAGQLYESGMRVELVADEFGVDRRYLRRELPKAGFPMRRPGQRKRG